MLHEQADGAALLATERLDPRRAAIATESISIRWNSVPDQEGDTTYLCVVDDDRMAVSLIQSNAAGFGSWLVEPSTGINLHNRGLGFSLEAGHPAELGPGRRPPHTLCPLLVTAPDGSLAATLGTMGGDGQPQILLQVLARLLRHGQQPAEAIGGGRWVLRRGGSGFDTWTGAGRPDVLDRGPCATGVGGRADPARAPRRTDGAVRLRLRPCPLHRHRGRRQPGRRRRPPRPGRQRRRGLIDRRYVLSVVPDADPNRDILILREVHLGDGAPTDVWLEGGCGTITAVGCGSPPPAGATVLDLEGYVVLPSAVEPHAHLDKAFLAERIANPQGDLLGAIEAMHANRHDLTVEDIAERAERAARVMVAHGVTAIRSHADTMSDHGLRSIEGLAQARDRLGGLVELQIVALIGWPITGPAGARAPRAAARCARRRGRRRRWLSAPRG